MQRRKWNPVRSLLKLPIYYKVIVANSAMALTVIVTLLTFRTALVAAVIVVASGITNALLVRAAFHVEKHRLKQRQLLAWTLSRSEQERSRVAGQLQDDAAQRLAALALNSAGHRAIADEAAAVMEQLCNTAQTLRPPGFQLLGLKGALSWYARSLASRFGTTIELSLDQSLETLDPALALGIYRILEDVLESAARQGENVDLTVTHAATGTAILLRLEHALTSAEHFRLVERTALLGGETETANRHSQTFVSLTIPLQERRHHVGHDSRLAG
jgi:signal transduction histidine kinase